MSSSAASVHRHAGAPLVERASGGTGPRMLLRSDDKSRLTREAVKGDDSTPSLGRYVVVGTLAGAAGGSLRGAAGGLVAGLLFGNLAVTTHIELLGRIIATIGGLIAGVWVAVAAENENPSGNERNPSRAKRALCRGKRPSYFTL